MGVQEAPPPAAPGRELSVREFRPEDEQPLVDMYSSVFRTRSHDEWRWLFRGAPAGPARIDVLVCDDDVAGCIVHVPAAVWVERRLLRLAVGCDLIVLPAYRGRGGARLLAAGFHEGDHGFDMNFGVVNEASGHVTGSVLGTTTMGRAQRWVRFRSRGERVGGPVRAAISVAERCYGALTGALAPRLEVVDLDDPGGDADDLARDSAAFAPCIRVRNASYLRWHWLEQPGGGWRIRAVRGAAGRLDGFAVLGVRDEDGSRVGVVADILARDYGTTRALLADAWRHLAAQGCNRVVCTYADPRAWARRAMLRSGFRPIPGPLVACGALSPAAGDAVGRLESWYLTYGDTDI